MKKNSIVISICLMLCVSLCACSQAPSSGQSVSPSDETSYYLENYDELEQIFDKDQTSPIAEQIKLQKNEYGQQYATFIDALFESGDVKQPMMNGKKMRLDDLSDGAIVAIKTHEMYDIPWVWFNCLVDGRYVIVKMAYPQEIGVQGITSDMDASEVVRCIKPDALNVHNQWKFRGVKVEEETLQLANETVTAMVYRYNKGNDRPWVTFYYKDVLVSVRTEEENLTDAFWAGFDIE